MSYHADYNRRRRASDLAYAERQRQLSLAAKRRRKGVCERCRGETRYNGKTVPGASRICSDCYREERYENRRWTRETIVRAFRRFQDETGRVPRAADAMGPHESIVARLSGQRIRELELVRELGLVLPLPAAVRREFGSWNRGLEAAGMALSRGGGGTHRRRSF